MERKRILGFIPAKGGSTRLAKKNIRALAGKSLLAWTAEAARGSGLIDRLVISTEDEEVAAEARRLGIEVPFMRPPELARDPAGIVDVALHALSVLEASGDSYDTLVILPPTSPFRNAQDIIAAHKLFFDSRSGFLMSVSAFSHTPFAALALDGQGILTPYFPEHIGKKSQEMPSAFRPNGAIHILDVPSFKRTRDYFSPPLVGYVMPRERSADIDTEDDLREAEASLRAAGR